MRVPHDAKPLTSVTSGFKKTKQYRMQADIALGVMPK